jgi:TolB-like protein/Tfp pilus assembly protein PilF
MDGDPPAHPNSTTPPQTPHDRLDSWKDIAAYLKRSVPTVQRWERDEALPVHRHQHRKQGSVYAYRPELDAWWRERRARLDTGNRPEEPAPASVEPAVQTRRRRWAAIAALAGILVVVIAVAAVLWLRRWPAASGGRIMVAILPFQNLGGGPSLEYITDGLTEELITELATVNPDQLGIIARTSAMAYKNTEKTVRDIGGELSVQYIVEGSVRFADGQSRITTQLIRVSDQSHLWAHTYDGKSDEGLKAEQDIARAVAAEVNARLTSGQPRVSRQAAVDPEAYRLYMQGRQLWNKRSQVDLEGSIDLYEQALKRDPQFARAYAGLADSWNMLGYFGFRPLGIVIPKSQQAARKALELDENQAAAHAALGYVNAMWLWEWRDAESRFQRALQLEPNYVPAHHYYALFLAAAGRLADARREIDIALRLDPLAPAVNTGAAYILYFDRQYDRSIDHCQRAIAQDATNAVAYALQGWDLVQMKRYGEGISSLQHAVELAPDNGLYVATLARAFTLAGDRDRAEQAVTRLDDISKRKWVGASMRAIIDTARGDRDAAFKWLDAAIRQEDGFLLWTKVTPEFDPLRSDARFAAFLERLKLP